MQPQKLFLFLLLLLSSDIAFSQSDWKKDIEYLRTELPANHVNFFSVKGKEEWDKGLDQIEKNVAGKSDLTVCLELDQLIVTFGDAHTGMGWNPLIDKNEMLPAKFYWFSDGIYITQTTKRNERVLGKKILAINNVPIEKVTQQLNTLASLDNNALMLSRVPKLLPMIQLLQYFNIVKGDSVMITFEDTLAMRVDHTVVRSSAKEEVVAVRPVSIPFEWQHEKKLFVEKYFTADSTYFIQYNRCWSKELEDEYNGGKNSESLPSFKVFEDKVFKTFAENPVKKVIVDLRFNSGGNSKQGTDFIKKIAANPKMNRKGVLYVITGRQTFSSAVINATDFKNLTKAIFVGEETSGKPNHFGEVKKFNLPSSNIEVVYSTKYFEKEKGNNKNFIPEYKFAPSFNDFMNGIDPSTTAIRKGELIINN